MRGLGDKTYTSGDLGRPRHQDDDEGRRSFGQDGRMNDRAIRAAMPVDKVMENARRYTNRDLLPCAAFETMRNPTPELREKLSREGKAPAPCRRERPTPRPNAGL